MRLRYFHREIKVATSSYDSGAQPWRVGNACIGSYENRFFPPSGLVSRRYLYPPRACHSETIQSCQPVPLASVALLLRRARFDDAVGRLGLRRIGPRPHHSLLLGSLAAGLGRSVQKKKMTKEGERGSVAVWRKKMTPALALAPKFNDLFVETIKKGRRLSSQPSPRTS